MSIDTNANGDPMPIRDDMYYTKLSRVNEYFVKWVTSFMEQSKEWDFTPACTDYIKHVEKLRRDFPVLEEAEMCYADEMPSCSTVNGEDKTQIPAPSLASKLQSPIVKQPEPLKVAAFKPIVPALTPSTSTQQPSEIDGDATEENDNMPPETQLEIFVEKEAHYTTKCKLFYKRDGKFIDYGLGQLYIKSTDNEKNQLLIRANNASATILLNIHLAKSLPIVLNDKGVLLTCVANPPIPKNDAPSICFYIKVKDKQSAATLNDKLKAFQS